MKITRKTIANFHLYVLAFDRLRGDEFDPFEPQVQASPGGLTAVECFSLLDNKGQGSTTREPGLLARCQSGKALINFWIQQWAEGIHHGLFTVAEIKGDRSWVPERFWKSMMRQLAKLDTRSGEFPRLTEPSG